ncbi:MAG TPA: hypothetical protein DCZ02_02605 [Ruminococcaceae bacterium]|nr:hypothetical protein [Oscillospiraceae bacterium]
MKKTIKTLICLCLCAVMALSFSSCSKTKMTEENIIETVETVETALKTFDTETLGKYVKSSTLDYIIKLADSHDQFVQLGCKIFENVVLDVKEVDLKNETVTISVSNKKIDQVAENFANSLKSKYSTFELLKMLDNEEFLNTSLSDLRYKMSTANETVQADVTVKVSKGDKNLVLDLDETAEDAFSGGALNAIKKIYG